MFRDLKEYQEIAKIYADKVSKPENLEERRGSSVQQLSQNRKDAFKPVTPPQKGAGGGVGNPTNTRGTGTGAVKFQKPTGAAQGRTKRPEIKKPLPSTAEIRAKNPKVVPGTRVNEIGAKGGGKPSSGDLSMFKDKKQATPTPTPTPQAKPKMGSPDSKFIKKDKGVGFVKRGTPNAQRAENKEKARNRAKEMAKARLAAKNKPAGGSAPKAAGAAGEPKAAGGSTAGGGASATKKIDGKGLASKMGAEKTASSGKSNTVPSGSFGISAKGKEQAAANKAEVANKKTSGNTSSMNVSSTKKMSPEMQKRVAQTQVGKNAAKEIDRIKPKVGQTVTTKTNNDGSTSSKVTTGTGGGTAGATSSAGSLEANKKKAAKMKEMEAKRNAMEKEFEIPESNQFDAYDLVLEYLLSTEQVATIEEANYVMTEMDAETIQGIVEEQKKNFDEGAGVAAAALAGGLLTYGLYKRNQYKKDAEKRDEKTNFGKIQKATDAKNKALKDAGM